MGDNIHVDKQVPLKLYATTVLAQCKLPILLCERDLAYCLIPKGMLSQMLAALCDINQTHLYGNTCIQHNHPSLLYTSGEDLSACKGQKSHN